MVKQITDVSTELGINLDVQMYSENVCQLFGEQPKFTAKNMLRAEKELPSTDQAKVDSFNEKVKPIIDGVKGVNIKVVSKLSAGDFYKTIGNVMPFEGEAPVEITHNEGEVVLVDFWATWCPPCQKPMAHNQEMLEKRKEDWAGKVRIIGLSIDQSKEAMVKHVNDKGWTAVEHYHRDKSDCSEVYGVSGVPHVLLLDTKGRIVYKGHPATRKDLEADFDTLLKGEALTGEGAWVDGAAAASDSPAEEKPKDDDGFKELDAAKVEAEIADFKANCERWCTDDKIKEEAKGMARNFCVITFVEKYDPKTGNMKSEYQNHRVIVGSEKQVEFFKNKYKEEVKSDLFEVKEQTHVIPAQ